MSARMLTRAVAVAISLALLAAPGGATARAGAGHPHADGDGVPIKVERALGGEVKPTADGLFKVRSPRGYTYTTHGPDLASDVGAGDVADHGAGLAPGDPERAPACAADPATDHYQEVLYAYPSSGSSELATKRAGIQAQIARMNAVVSEESIASGGPPADLEVRCESDGSVRVSAVEVPVGGSANASFTQIVDAAKAAGFGNRRVDYTIFYDGPGPAGVCGTGYLYGDESLAAGNLNNNPGGTVSGGYGASYRGCWFGRTPLHENAHNQGAVQTNAPSSTGNGGHCNQQDDVMCYVDGGDRNQTMVACPTEPGTLHFDCGWDTYFDSAPEAGEYLASNWNLGSPLNRFIRFGGPAVGFSVSCAALTCAFTDESTSSSGIASRSWSFGDGASSSAPNPTHAYGTPAGYEVTLTVVDGAGVTSSLTRHLALNDDFAQPQELAGPAAALTGSTVDASKELGEPAHAGNSGGASVWYRWSAPATGTATIDTCGSSFDTLLAVYTGSTVDGLTPVASDDDDDAGLGTCGDDTRQSAVSFDASSGTVYRIAVDGFGGASGAVSLGLDSAPDTVAPQTSITGGPADGGATRDQTPSFGLRSSEDGSSFECSVDGAAFGPCSGPGASHTTAPLADGLHTFAARASDRAGNVDPTPAARSFTLDTAAPDTGIDDGPSATITSAEVSFSFSAVDPGSAPASFECQLDGTGYGSCTSPRSLVGLGDGAHLFEVRARDAAGNVDPSPAARSFTVERPNPQPAGDGEAPETSLTERPPSTVRVRRRAAVSFGFIASEAGASFGCELDGGGFEACGSPKLYRRLGSGRHEFRVIAIDAAGNADRTPASDRFKVRRRR